MQNSSHSNVVGIVVDMGGTMIKIGIVRDGVILSNLRVPADSHMSLRDKIDEIAGEIDVLIQRGSYTPIGVGIAFPGIVDINSSKILSRYVKYPDAQEVDLSKWANERWSLPLVVENDARAALLGEWRYGAGTGYNDLALVTLGTGFGSAVMINGKLLRGRHHFAGNLGGHMTINLHGPVCNCGNIGCLETECSSWAIGNYIRSRPDFGTSGFKGGTELSFRTIFQAAARQDKFMSEVLIHCLNVWSTGIINFIHAYDPERIIIGGGVMKSQDVILPHVRRMVKEHSWIRDDAVEIVPAEQVEFAGLLGMYHLLSARELTGYKADKITKGV